MGIALEQRCAEAGRDRATLETSSLVFAMIDEDGDRARRIQRDYLRSVGIIVNLVPNGHQPGVVAMVGEMLGKLLR